MPPQVMVAARGALPLAPGGKIRDGGDREAAVGSERETVDLLADAALGLPEDDRWDLGAVGIHREGDGVVAELGIAGRRRYIDLLNALWRGSGAFAAKPMNATAPTACLRRFIDELPCQGAPHSPVGPFHTILDMLFLPFLQGSVGPHGLRRPVRLRSLTRRQSIVGRGLAPSPPCEWRETSRWFILRREGNIACCEFETWSAALTAGALILKASQSGEHRARGWRQDTGRSTSVGPKSKKPSWSNAGPRDPFACPSAASRQHRTFGSLWFRDSSHARERLRQSGLKLPAGTPMRFPH